MTGAVSPHATPDQASSGKESADQEISGQKNPDQESPDQPPGGNGLAARRGQLAALWINKLTLTNFRNYAQLGLALDQRPVVLTGSNGAGKTNLMEAVSLLAPGRGLRRVAFNELARMDSQNDGTSGDGSWSVSAQVISNNTTVTIGTGQRERAASARSGRIVRINGDQKTGSGVLADHVEMIWLTPAMDGLFAGPASERRRFLDRLILCFDPSYRRRLGQFERAMRQRNKLLEEGVRDNARLEGLEVIMAETGVAIAAGRAEAVAGLSVMIAARWERAGGSIAASAGKQASAVESVGADLAGSQSTDLMAADPMAAGTNPFPWAEIALQGRLESDIAVHPAVDVEDSYLRALRDGRERDRAAKRTLEGPHRSDLLVGHGPKSMPAKVCSTGEQKALLVGLVLAHAQLIKQHAEVVPILLLDEIAAHLDELRRAALFDEILTLGCQAWMTGTDAYAFSALGENAQFFEVEEGCVSPAA